MLCCDQETPLSRNAPEPITDRLGGKVFLRSTARDWRETRIRVEWIQSIKVTKAATHPIETLAASEGEPPLARMQEIMQILTAGP
jgi:hypothetical protein